MLILRHFAVAALLPFGVACSNDNPQPTDTSDAMETTPSEVADAEADSETPEAVSPGEIIEPDVGALLERTSLATHTCKLDRPLTAASADNKIIESLMWTPTSVVAGVQFNDLTLARIGVDGALGAQASIDDVDYRSSSSSLAYRDGSVGAAWFATDSQSGSSGNIHFARYASNDLTLEVAAKDLGLAAGSYNAQPQLLAIGDGFGLFWSEQSENGAALKYARLSPDGVVQGAPVVIDQGSDNTSGFGQSVAYLNGGGFAAMYAKGPYDASEVFYTQLGLDGQRLAGPIRVSRPGGNGVSSGANALGNPNGIVQIGATTYAVFSESVAARPNNFDARDESIIVRLAVIDGLTPHLYGLQAPEIDMESSSPSIFVVGGKLGVMWSYGTIIYICAGCMADFEMRFALLDPATLTPLAPTVVDAPATANGYRVPRAVVLPDQRLLTTARIDFHALTRPATGLVSCTAR